MRLSNGTEFDVKLTQFIYQKVRAKLQNTMHHFHGFMIRVKLRKVHHIQLPRSLKNPFNLITNNKYISTNNKYIQFDKYKYIVKNIQIKPSTYLSRF